MKCDNCNNTRLKRLRFKNIPETNIREIYYTCPQCHAEIKTQEAVVKCDLPEKSTINFIAKNLPHVSHQGLKKIKNLIDSHLQITTH